MEHRRGRRIAVDIPIEIAVWDAAIIRKAQLANWSITGALIKADFQIRALSRVRIVFDCWAQLSGGALSIDAYIARNHQHGIGVEWYELASPAVTKLFSEVTASRPVRGARTEPVRSSLVAHL